MTITSEDSLQPPSRPSETDQDNNTNFSTSKFDPQPNSFNRDPDTMPGRHCMEIRDAEDAIDVARFDKELRKREFNVIVLRSTVDTALMQVRKNPEKYENSVEICSRLTEEIKALAIEHARSSTEKSTFMKSRSWMSMYEHASIADPQHESKLKRNLFSPHVSIRPSIDIEQPMIQRFGWLHRLGFRVPDFLRFAT